MIKNIKCFPRRQFLKQKKNKNFFLNPFYLTPRLNIKSYINAEVCKTTYYCCRVCKFVKALYLSCCVEILTFMWDWKMSHVCGLSCVLCHFTWKFIKLLVSLFEKITFSAKSFESNVISQTFYGSCSLINVYKGLLSFPLLSLKREQCHNVW